MRMVIVCLHMALDDDKQIIRKNFLSLKKLEIAMRMYKVCLLVIVLGFGVPMVSLQVFVQCYSQEHSTHLRLGWPT